MNAPASFPPVWRFSGGIFDIAGKKSRIGELEVEASQPDFWLANDKAQASLREQARLKATVDIFEAQVKAIEDASVLIELADEAKDEPTAREASTTLSTSEEAVARWNSRACYRVPTTGTVRSSQSMRVPEEPSLRTGPRCCSACTCAGVSAVATGARSSISSPATRPASRA